MNNYMNDFMAATEWIAFIMSNERDDAGALIAALSAAADCALKVGICPKPWREMRYRLVVANTRMQKVMDDISVLAKKSHFAFPKILHQLGNGVMGPYVESPASEDKVISKWNLYTVSEHGFALYIEEGIPNYAHFEIGKDGKFIRSFD